MKDQARAPSLCNTTGLDLDIRLHVFHRWTSHAVGRFDRSIRTQSLPQLT